jgi:hypothetical protein
MKLIQSVTPVPESKIWSLQKDFYGERGKKAWSESIIPQGPTSNCYMADTYAAIIAAFFRDLVRAGWPDPPIIIEAGGGSGILAWQILHRLLKHELAEMKDIPAFNYLLTDGAQSNVENWKTKKRFDPLRKSGLLDFGTLWVRDTLEIHTEGSGLITVNELANRPVILITNYLHCSIPCDLYKISNHQISRELIALYERDSEPGKKETGPFERLNAEFTSEEREFPYTGHTRIDAILEKYRALPGDPYIPVPEISIRFLEIFLNREVPFLKLAGDLGYTESTTFRNDDPFIFSRYFAYYTNFHMMGEIVKGYGGDVQYQAFQDRHFSTVAFMRPGPVGVLEETRQVAKARLYDFTPYDAYILLKTIKGKIRKATYHQIASLLRFGRFDQRVARACIPLIIKECKGGGSLNVNQIRDMYIESYEAFFPDGSDDDFDLEIARLFLLLGLHMDAQLLLERGMAEFGSTHQRRLLIALALKGLEEKTNVSTGG